MKQKKTLRFLALFLTLLLIVTALPLSVFAANVAEDSEEEEAVVSDDVSLSSDAERETAPLRDGNDGPMDGVYTLFNYWEGDMLEVNNAATGSGSVVGLTDEIGYEDHQQFLVRKVGDNEYTFQPLHAPSMGVASVGTLGAGVTIEPYDPDDPAQRFSLTVSSYDGIYIIRTKASNFQYVLSYGENASVSEQVYIENEYKYMAWWEFDSSAPTSGVYALQNYDEGKYANAVNNSQGTPVNVTNSGVRFVYQTAFADSPASSSSPVFTALFKLHYRPETQDYIIRNMMDNLLILSHETDDCVLAKRNGVTDDTTTSYYSWKISMCGYDWCGNNYYYIWYESSGGTRYYLTMAAHRIFVVNNVNYAIRWSFDDYTGTAQNFRAYNYNVSPDYEIVQPGAQIDVSTTKAGPYNYSFYSTEIGVNTPGNAIYRVRNVNGTATSAASITLTTGILTFDPNKCGMVRVTITFARGGSFYTDYYAPPTSNNIIVLQNIMGSVGYAKGFTSFATKAALTEGAFTDTQFWEKIQSPWSGYYYLKNVGNGLYLSVPNNTTMDADLVMVSSATGNRQAWKIIQTSSGQVKIRSRRDELAGNNLYINVKPSSTRLIQGTFVQNNSYYDEFNVLVVGTGILCGSPSSAQLTFAEPSLGFAYQSQLREPYALPCPDAKWEPKASSELIR